VRLQHARRIARVEFVDGPCDVLVDFGQNDSEIQRRRRIPESAQGGIHPVEQGGFLRGLVGDSGFDQRDRGDGRARPRAARPAPLGSLKTQSGGGDLRVRHPDLRIVGAGVDADDARLIRAHAAIQLLNFPRAQTFAKLLRKQLRIGGRFEYFRADDAGRLVIAVAVADVTRKARNDYIGPIQPDHPHRIAQYVFFPPMLQGFIQTFRESEIGRAGEELIDAVIAVRREQLIGAQNS
jgi:hypothetical protein